MLNAIKAIGNFGGKIKRAIGELSSWDSIVNMNGGSMTSMYSLDSKRVDIKLARELYYNENDDYKLGAGFAKPIINAVVGFMGVPKFILDEDANAEATLEQFREENISRMQRTHRNTIRDGKCYVRLTRLELDNSSERLLYPERDTIIKYNIVPPENIKEIKRDTITGRAIEYVIETTHDIASKHGTVTVTQTITPDTIEVTCDGTAPEGLETGKSKNVWGFIPILEFTNEKEAHSRAPRSDLEGVEPYIKAYHDVFKHAIQGSKLHSTPRLKLTVKDVAGFLKNNFGITNPEEHINSGQPINLEKKDLLIFTDDDEDAQFIEVESAIGSAEPLLKFLFYSVIENSETPEFLFGAHLPANYASVKEQMPVLVRRVGRKREYFSETWKLLARYVLAMNSLAGGAKFKTHNTSLEWDKIDPRDASDVAKELKDTTDALDTALETQIISKKSASTYLSTIIKLMEDYEAEEKAIQEDQGKKGNEGNQGNNGNKGNEGNEGDQSD